MISPLGSKGTGHVKMTRTERAQKESDTLHTMKLHSIRIRLFECATIRDLCSLYLLVLLASVSVYGDDLGECGKAFDGLLNVSLASIPRDIQPLTPADSANRTPFTAVAEDSVGNLYSGEAEWEELVPNYWIVRIRQSNGVSHLLDPQQVRIYRVPVEWRIKDERVRRKSWVKLNEETLKSAWCKILLLYNGNPNHPEIKPLRDAVESNHSRLLVNRSILECMAGLAIAFPSLAEIARIQTMPARTNFYEEHAPNFFLSMTYLSIIHNCLTAGQIGGLYRESRGAVAGVLVGGSIAGNSWEEIAFGEHRSLLNGNKIVKTDMGDLGAGLTATALYALAAYVYESRFGPIPVAQWCKN